MTNHFEQIARLRIPGGAEHAHQTFCGSFRDATEFLKPDRRVNVVAQNRFSRIEIFLPASAVPGWPADVVLPSDPVWKRDYSGSVRRIIRDGVDTPLASLFVHAARARSEDAEGAARARSATEAFLYRRLDTLRETNGRFRVNVALPIPFDGFGTLEVDLLCADARVAIELDGGQHLADPIAYRRDRRKDQLLQENGYFVLRFSCRGCR